MFFEIKKLNNQWIIFFFGRNSYYKNDPGGLYFYQDI